MLKLCCRKYIQLSSRITKNFSLGVYIYLFILIILIILRNRECNILNVIQPPRRLLSTKFFHFMKKKIRDGWVGDT